MPDSRTKYMELLKLKLSLLEQMYSNTEEQRIAIEGRHDEHLIDLLSQRAQLMDKIDAVNRITKQLQNEQVTIEVKELESRIQSQLKEIYDLDQKNQQAAMVFKEELEKSIYQINLGKKAINQGYFNNQPQTFGYFIDKKIGK